jgi:hypothetical protein
MKALLLFIAWCVLFALSWPIALLALICSASVENAGLWIELTH